MQSIYEKPGAHTPWQSINQLLDSQERLEWFLKGSVTYLFAPKTLSKLSALIYLLKEERVSYSVQNQGEALASKDSVWISVRSFSEVKWLGEGCMAVGAGASLFQLRSKLFEENHELGVEDLSGRHRSIASFLLGAPPVGLFLRQEALAERLLQVEWVNGDGGIVKWGRGLPGSGGPCLSPLIWGLRDLKAVLVKVVFKVDPIPLERLFLSWSFLRRDELWDQFDRLHSLTATWERLDLVIPNDPLQKGFLLAQISGTKEEMRAFLNLCPKFAQAELGEKVFQLRKFFEQQCFHFQPIKCWEGAEEKESVGYRWYHGLTDQSWLVHPLSRNETIDEPPEWKKRFWSSLNN